MKTLALALTALVAVACGTTDPAKPDTTQNKTNNAAGDEITLDLTDLVLEDGIFKVADGKESGLVFQQENFVEKGEDEAGFEIDMSFTKPGEKHGVSVYTYTDNEEFGAGYGLHFYVDDSHGHDDMEFTMEVYRNGENVSGHVHLFEVDFQGLFETKFRIDIHPAEPHIIVMKNEGNPLENVIWNSDDQNDFDLNKATLGTKWGARVYEGAEFAISEPKEVIFEDE